MSSTRPIEDMIETPRRHSLDTLQEAISSESVEIVGKELKKLELEPGKYTSLDISDTSVASGVINNVDSFNGILLRCEFSSAEATGFSIPQANIKDVVFKNCRLTLANFRDCTFTRCVFIDCTLDEADFGMSTLRHVLFSNCQLNNTIFSRADCDHVEFIESNLAAIKGVDGLKGASISEFNLVELAPLLAAIHGIKIL